MSARMVGLLGCAALWAALVFAAALLTGCGGGADDDAYPDQRASVPHLDCKQRPEVCR